MSPWSVGSVGSPLLKPSTMGMWFSCLGRAVRSCAVPDRGGPGATQRPSAVPGGVGGGVGEPLVHGLPVLRRERLNLLVHPVEPGRVTGGDDQFGGDVVGAPAHDGLLSRVGCRRPRRSSRSLRGRVWG